MRSSTTRVGLFAIGLDAYWPQFEGLRERLEGYARTVASRLKRDKIELVDLGLIDTPESAAEAGHRFRREEVDLIFLHVTTYALSHTVLPVVRRAGVPVIVLNLQPVRRIDYEAFNALNDRTAMTGEWLAHCGACPVPEIANVFNRARIDFHQVTGTLDESDPCGAEIDAWLEAARVRSVMEHNRLGVMGHYYNGMLDIQSDLTQQVVHFGGHVEHIEPDELAALRREVDDQAVQLKRSEFDEAFDIRKDVDPADLDRAARTAVALDQLVDQRRLGSLAYFFHSVPGHENEDVISSIILGTSLLTARGVPVAGELEIKNAQAMKILDTLGVGGSFTEYYAFDFDDDIVLMGHDGPGHVAIAQGRPRVRPLEVYHGKIGKGLSIEMSVRHGPVTLLSVVQTVGGGLALLVAEGASEPGPILEIGNTNSRYRFDVGARAFAEAWNARGPAHHCAVGVGHVARRIEMLGKLLGLEVIRIC